LVLAWSSSSSSSSNSSEGPPKKNDRPPRAFAKPQTYPPASRSPHPRLGFFLKRVVGRFSVRGVQKHHRDVLQEVHVENFSPKNRQNFDVSFSSTFFVSKIAFLGVSQRWEFKYTTKNVLQKKCVKQNYKRIDKKPQTDFFSNCFNHVFGRFSVRGVQKHH
jgi:hypothetical protein